MNYHTCRDECITIVELLKKLKTSEEFKETMFDIELHVCRQKAKIESDIKQLNHELKDKQFDMECYDYLLSEIEKIKSEVEE